MRARLAAALAALLGAAGIVAGAGAQTTEGVERVEGLPEVQTRPAWDSDRRRDGAAAAEPASFERGEAVAVGSALDPAHVCNACHGLAGEGNGYEIPRITGLPAWYIAKQLHSYETGTRQNAQMQQVVEAMTPQQQLDVAVYYASIEAPLLPPPAPEDVDEALREHGARIASEGLAERGILGCQNCHAADGAGLPPDVPYLAGQYQLYIEAQLRAWVDGTRANDEGNVMRAIAEKMTERDMRAVGLHYELLRPAED